MDRRFCLGLLVGAWLTPACRVAAQVDERISRVGILRPGPPGTNGASNWPTVD